MTNPQSAIRDPQCLGPLGRVAAFGRLVKFSHTIFALPFALLGMVLAARGWPGWGKLGLILACMVTARSAAMTFNRLADFRIDAANPRTAGRPLQTGEVTAWQAWAFYAVCCLGFVAACAGFWRVYDNVWPLVLAVPVLAYVSLYSLAKRHTALCHLMLGGALGASPMAAWLAVSPQTFGWAAVVLGAAVACWVGGFDIIYALQDIEFDRRQGLRSLPARLGPAGALRISRGLHVLTVGLLVALAPLAGLGWVYLVGVAAAAMLLAAEQAMVSPRDWRRAGAAFVYANAAMSVVLCAAGVIDVLRLSS